MGSMMNHRGKRRLGRRVFLKALGLGVAAPLAMQMGRLAMAEPNGTPVRLCIIYVPNGVPVEHYETSGSATGSYVLEPLAAYDSWIKQIRGLSMNDGANNHPAVRATLTGFAEGVDGSGNPSDSIDVRIAKALGTKAHALGAIAYDQWFSSDSFLVHDGAWVRPIESPAAAAEALFEGIGGEQMGPGDADFRQLALQLTETEVGRMHGELSHLTKEQNKLAVHLQAIQELQSVGPTVSSCDQVPSLPLADATAGIDVFAADNFGKLFDGHLEVAAHALRCGTAQVMTLQLLEATGEIHFNFPGGPGINGEYHNKISHGWGDAGRLEFATCLRWIHERIAQVMLPVLDQPDPYDSTKSVLDNTLIYVCSEIADGYQHNSQAGEVWLDGTSIPTYLPTLTIGGAGGYLSSEPIVTVERNHIDMLATLAEAMGAPMSTIGGQEVSVIAELKA